jgi:outer membrane receptor protein involved in Fe transport
MTKKSWLLTSALCLAATSAFAQEQTDATAAPAPAAEATPEPAAEAADAGEIIVTATRRSMSLSDVPIAVSAISADTMRNSGVSDIRGLNQLSPSLLVSSSQSEAAGGVARIRGVGTVGDNPGLESSVATFVDGVYRNRSSVALTELGAIERIEVLRGPQGTLFGRNASAGLINVITASPSFTEGGTAELSYGNYDYWRAAIGLTGPINEKIAYRIDGIYMKRDGFLKESDDYVGATGRDFNNRDRWLARGQLKFEPSDVLNIRLIADYAKRNEECCAATFLPARETFITPAGNLGTRPNSFAALARRLGGVINDDTFGQRVSVTPGRDYRSDVKEWGVSGEVNWEIGGAKLTSITAYRDWDLDRGTDPDFNNLDILYRDKYRQRFRTFTQELRLQGKAFEDKLDWLVGAYYGDESLYLRDNLRFGADYGRLQSCRLVSGAIGLLGLPSITLSPTSPGCVSPLVRPGIPLAFPAPARPAVNALLSTLDRLGSIGDSGSTGDVFRQKDRTWALFTHNVFDITDQLSLTLGARYTSDRKRLNATIASDTTVCLQQAAVIQPLLAQIAAGAAAGAISPQTAATLNLLASNIQGLSCANGIGGGMDGTYNDKRSDSEWSGTAVLSFKPTDRLLTYASFSKGFKAGGFNLDRAGMTPGAASVASLPFAAETVDAFELGTKYRGRGFRVAASAFYQMFKNFQLNTFNGVNFAVENIEGCSELAGGDGADSDLSAATGACTGKSRAGVVSKGVELEASLYPTRTLSFDAGLTYAKTEYRNNVSGLDGRPLPPTLLAIPGNALSNAPRVVVTSGATWTPPLGSNGLSALVHADVRMQSSTNTGSDLLPEKREPGPAVVNARLGINGKDNAWSVELWAQNLFDYEYRQIVAGAPLQGSGSIATLRAGTPGVAAVADSLFIVFPAEPRTYGLTVRTKF